MKPLSACLALGKKFGFSKSLNEDDF